MRIDITLVKFAVYNSLATFVSQKPLDLGADYSFFSATKYISGHGSVTAGALAVKNESDIENVKYCANALARSLNPFDVYIVSLGLATLPIRMQQHEKTALELAKRLQNHKKIKEVRCSGLESHENFILAKKQMKYTPGVFTVNCDSLDTAEKLVAQTKLFGEKASFGTADSRMEIPAKISHASFTKAELEKIKIYDTTVRISVGLEDIEDLWEDINAVLK